MTKKNSIKKAILYILISLIMLGILLYGTLYFFTYAKQGEYKNYPNGVTIEVKNSSDQIISDLKFSFGYLGNIEFQELGEIKQIKPGQSTKLTNKSINRTNDDLSMYLQYYLKNGEKKLENSLAYLSGKYPKKVVVIVDITKVDDEGNLHINYKGYDGFIQYYGEIDPDREN